MDVVEFELEGFDEAMDELDELGRKAQELEGEQEVPIEELLTSSFMRRRTNFSSFEEMLEASQWDVETQEDFEAIPDDEWDRFVAEHSRFPNWEEMLGAAAQAWAARQLGLK